MKKTFKKLYLTTLNILTLPLFIFAYTFYKVGFSYKTVAIAISVFPGYFGLSLRRFFYTNTLKKCGKNLQVGFCAYFVYPETEVGENFAVEEFSIISLCSVGNDVIVAARCSLMSGAHHHDIDDMSTTFLHSKDGARKIILGDNIWIGTHAVVMADIASGTVVGAGSIVTKKFAINDVILGVPAKKLRSRGGTN